jgi:phasin family protein
VDQLRAATHKKVFDSQTSLRKIRFVHRNKGDAKTNRPVVAVHVTIEELDMFTTPAQLAELNKTQMDALYALSHTMFSATERLVDLNLTAAKALLDESTERAQMLMGVKDVQDFMAVAGGLAQPSLDKAVAYSRNVYGIASGVNAEASKIFEAQIAEGNKKVVAMIDFAGKNAPAGSEPFVSMLKSAMAASNTAYDTFTKASKQAMDMVESNVAVAASATVKAAGDVTKSKIRKSA